MEQVGERPFGLHQTVALVAAAFLALALFSAPTLNQWARRLSDEPQLVYDTFDYDRVVNSATLQGLIQGWGAMKRGLVSGTRIWQTAVEPMGLNAVFLGAREVRRRAQGVQWDGSVQMAPDPMALDPAGLGIDGGTLPSAGDPAAPYDPSAPYQPGEAYDPAAPYEPAPYDPAPYDPAAPYEPAEPYQPAEPYRPADDIPSADP